MRKIMSILILFLFIVSVLFAAKSFRVPNGFGKVDLTEVQKAEIQKVHNDIYTVEVLNSITAFEIQKVTWRKKYLIAAWNILTDEQKTVMPEKYRIRE